MLPTNTSSAHCRGRELAIAITGSLRESDKKKKDSAILQRNIHAQSEHEMSLSVEDNFGNEAVKLRFECPLLFP
jgi:hypothetical protein